MKSFYVDTNILNDSYKYDGENLSFYCPSFIGNLINCGFEIKIPEIVIDELTRRCFESITKKNETLSYFSDDIVDKSKIWNPEFFEVKEKIIKYFKDIDFNIVPYDFTQIDLGDVVDKSVKSIKPFESISGRTGDKGFKDTIFVLSVIIDITNNEKIVVSEDNVIINMKSQKKEFSTMSKEMFLKFSEIENLKFKLQDYVNNSVNENFGNISKIYYCIDQKIINFNGEVTTIYRNLTESNFLIESHKNELVGYVIRNSSDVLLYFDITSSEFYINSIYDVVLDYSQDVKLDNYIVLELGDDKHEKI